MQRGSNKPSHITHGDVLDDLGLSHAEALEAEIKADLWRDLVLHIGKLELPQKQIAQRLGIHQPDVSNLLNGKLSKFGVGTLIQFAVRMELGVTVKITAPKSGKLKTVRAARTTPVRKALRA